MIKLQDISYVRLGTADLEGATNFATIISALKSPPFEGHGLFQVRSARAYALLFHRLPGDQTAAFEVAERADLEAAAAELDRIGHPVRFGSAKEAELRHVRSFIAFKDPTGNNIELVWRPAYSSQRYHGERDAGITGFSHIGLCTTDAARDEAFWTKVCNARVSDRIGDAALLRIDEVHHTIALFPTNRAGIQHINHQVETGDDVMRSFNFCPSGRCRWCLARAGIRHPPPGSSISKGPMEWCLNILPACARSPTNCSIANGSFHSIRKASANGARSRRSRNSAIERLAFGSRRPPTLLDAQ